MTESPRKGPLSLRILVVDDDEPVRDSLRSFLADRYLHVDEASNGKEALARARENTYDVVIADIRMPYLDGVGLLKELQRESPLVKVVLVTGYASLDTAVEASRHHAYDYIRKPYDLSQIDAVLRKIHDEKRKSETEERHRAEETCRARFQALGALTSTIMHEINNPNTIILGHVDVLQNLFFSPLNEEALLRGSTASQVSRSLEALRGASLRIDELIRRANAFATGHLMIPKATELVEAVTAALDQLDPEAARLVTLEASMGDSALRVASYPEEVLHVAKNLVSNAAEALRETENPRIRIEISGPDEAGRACLAVEDNGPGMKPDEAERIFDPFVSVKRDRPGRGLGLFIVRQLVESRGGSITVETAPGKGLRMVVKWPLMREEEIMAGSRK